MITVVYDWGLDDSVHYFMTLEAENYIEHGTSAASNASIAVYPTFESLPQPVRHVFGNQSWEEEELYFQSQGDQFFYLMPYYNSNADRLLFVLHTNYELSNNEMVGLSVGEIASLLALTIVVLTIGVIRNLGWSLIKPINALHEWNRQISAKNQNFTSAAPMPDFRFNELNEAAEQIRHSMIEINQRNDKEKQFLRVLSHELRTPLAITKASLELINKTKSQLDPKLANKLNKIERANANMCATSEVLLWLWSDDLTQFRTQQVDLNEIIKQEIESNQYLAANKSVNISLFEHEVFIEANPVLMQLLVRNLVRNALQYSADGNISIDFQPDSGLTLINPIASQDSSINEPNDYGYGIGLYLVTTLCEKMQWECEIQQNMEQFQVRIKTIR
ncbi:HAMP domain-containing sensor histidine kinase [Photobacterium sp. OFAV2-7]|uniref:sensor histidine kinase n=1 Tax=Photobacterium sp. OFAV2-7 TaxID=2917748 RepID=UPI001EF604C9|nr:HAMP domain-containing sensor histidine kinase [Photobacterium sp. OFAV2-7]